MTPDTAGLISDWLIRYTAGTRSQYRAAVDQYDRWLGDVDVLEAPRATVQRFVAWMTDAGYSPATIRAKTSAIASFYDYALSEKTIDTNPAVGIRRPLGESEPRFGLPADQARKLIAAAQEHSPAAYALIWLMAGTGLRVTEAVSADIEDLNLEAETVTVTTKRGHRRVKPLTRPVLEAVLAAANGRPAGPVLVGPGGNKLSRQRAWELVERLAIPLGIACSPHTLRHTAATLALEAGASVEDVSALLGHRSIETTLRYIRNRDILGGTRKAAEALAAALTTPARNTAQT